MTANMEVAPAAQVRVSAFIEMLCEWGSMSERAAVQGMDQSQVAPVGWRPI